MSTTPDWLKLLAKATADPSEAADFAGQDVDGDDLLTIRVPGAHGAVIRAVLGRHERPVAPRGSRDVPAAVAKPRPRDEELVVRERPLLTLAQPRCVIGDVHTPELWAVPTVRHDHVGAPVRGGEEG